MRLFDKRPVSEAEQHYREALRLRDRKSKDFNFRLAVQHLKQAIAREPANPLFHYQLGRAYVAAPLYAVTRGVEADFNISDAASLAIASSKEALRLKPDYVEAFVVLGEAYLYLGQTEKAVKSFESALSFKCDGKVRAYAEVESRQAEEGLSKKPDADRANEHLERAATYRGLGNYRDAERELDRALKLAPDWEWLYQRLCRYGK